MNSTKDPRFVTDTMRLILSQLSNADFKSARATCKDWKYYADDVTTNRLQLLINEYNVPEKLIPTLKSPETVLKRLAKIFKRGKIEELDDNILYKRYCASGNIDENFLRLLDTNEIWF